MVSLDNLANAIFGGHRAETQDVATDGATSTYVGVAVSDSEDGTVLVDLGGDVTLPDDLVDDDGTIIESYDGSGVEVPTGPSVRAGDTVMVTVVGGSALKSPMVTSAAGEGDRTNALAQLAKDVADAINQYFWTDTNGAHVTSVPQSDWEDSGGASYHSGPNVLINSLGQLFRDGLNNLLALTGGTTPGVAIYDGTGNTDAHIIASFVGNLIELGRNSTSAVIKFCGGKGLITYETGYDWMDIEADEGIHVSYKAKHKYSDLDPHWVSPAQGTVQSDVRLVYADGNQYDTSTTWAIEAGMLMDVSLNWHDDSAFLYNLHRAFVGAYTGNAETGYGTEDYVEEVPSRVEVGGRLLRVYVPEAVYNDGADDIDTTFDMRTLVEALKMVKTAGDTITATGLRIGGYITSNKMDCKLTIQTPFRFYGVSSCTISGTYTVRQGGIYLFGSTATAPCTFTGHHTIDSINSDLGTINVTINTGVAQSAATNNDPANIVLNTCTITLS